MCFTCGSTNLLQAGHYIHAASNTFFDEMNVHAQCVRCNMYLSGNLGLYSERLIKRYGLSAVEDLRRRSKEIKKWSPEELRALARKYKL